MAMIVGARPPTHCSGDGDDGDLRIHPTDIPLIHFSSPADDCCSTTAPLLLTSLTGGGPPLPIPQPITPCLPLYYTALNSPSSASSRRCSFFSSSSFSSSSSSFQLSSAEFSQRRHRNQHTTHTHPYQNRIGFGIFTEGENGKKKKPSPCPSSCPYLSHTTSDYSFPPFPPSYLSSPSLLAMRGMSTVSTSTAAPATIGNAATAVSFSSSSSLSSFSSASHMLRSSCFFSREGTTADDEYDLLPSISSSSSVLLGCPLLRPFTPPPPPLTGGTTATPLSPPLLSSLLRPSPSSTALLHTSTLPPTPSTLTPPLPLLSHYAYFDKNWQMEMVLGEGLLLMEEEEKEKEENTGCAAIDAVANPLGDRGEEEGSVDDGPPQTFAARTRRTMNTNKSLSLCFAKHRRRCSDVSSSYRRCGSDDDVSSSPPFSFSSYSLEGALSDTAEELPSSFGDADDDVDACATAGGIVGVVRVVATPPLTLFNAVIRGGAISDPADCCGGRGGLGVWDTINTHAVMGSSMRMSRMRGGGTAVEDLYADDADAFFNNGEYNDADSSVEGYRFEVPPRPPPHSSPHAVLHPSSSFCNVLLL